MIGKDEMRTLKRKELQGDGAAPRKDAEELCRTPTRKKMKNEDSRKKQCNWKVKRRERNWSKAKPWENCKVSGKKIRQLGEVKRIQNCRTERIGEMVQKYGRDI